MKILKFILIDVELNWIIIEEVKINFFDYILINGK